MNPNTIPDAPQIQAMTRSLSNLSCDQNPRPLKRAAVEIAQEISKSTPTENILSRCHDIEKDIPGGVTVPPREALAKYLVDNKVTNPGNLSDKHRHLCAWTLLEHTARSTEQGNTAQGLVSSYVKPKEYPQFKQIADSLDVPFHPHKD